MKKHNFVGENLNRLPPGFRFQPTDEELLFQYLRCKIFSLPLPASIIPEVHFPKLDPWELPGDSMEERYVFTKKGGRHKKRNQNNRSSRATNSGYWEDTGSEMHISPPPSQNFETMIITGIKKTLVYHMGRAPNGSPTDWYMNEYSLVYNNKNYKGVSKLEDWVIWHVFLKQRIEENDNAIMLDYNNSHYRLTSNIPSPCSSSSSSNSFAHVSSYELHSDEESNYNFM
ncbi:NAC domain-containing protein 41-like [Chenopodium quinoa]|uniref:NAC domain-containing protein 41-like n=1 Tax=Chenopodium quinoa TaxID=63459 RepID=UPI000B76C0AE|nr:NAC domain-containing protein 41-like [Chenopodium quinoa]